MYIGIIDPIGYRSYSHNLQRINDQFSRVIKI